MKKIVSAIMCLCVMLASFTAIQVNAVSDIDDEVYYEGFFLTIKSDTASICDTTPSFKPDKLIIPSTVVHDGKEYIVTEVAFNHDGFSNANYTRKLECTEIVFPDTVKEIHLYKNCLPNLKKFNIPINVKVFKTTLDLRKVEYDFDEANKYYFLKNNALYYKNKPTIMYRPMDISENYTIAAGTTKVKGFDNFDYVKKITFPSSVEKCTPIKNCDKLVTVDMSKAKMLYLCQYAFDNNKNLKKVILPKTVDSEELPRLAFHFSTFKLTKNNKVTSVTLPTNLKKINTDAFRHCKLESIKLPSTLTKISRGAFYGTSFKKVSFPKKLSYIGVGSFASNKKLESITIANGNCKVAAGAFGYCSNLKKVTITATKKAPKFAKDSLENTKSGIKFYVKNKTIAKQLKKNLKGSGVKNAKIYVRTNKLIYKNIG